LLDLMDLSADEQAADMALLEELFEEHAKPLHERISMRPDSLRRSTRRKYNHGKFDMRDYCVRTRGKRSDPDYGPRWPHLEPIEAQADDLYISPAPAQDRIEANLDLALQADERRMAFRRHRALTVAPELVEVDETRKPPKRRRSRRNRSPFTGVQQLMTERYGVPVS
jgi:hypothetical protein